MTNPRRALPVLMAGTFMIVLDFFIVNVAMPSMQRHLHAGSGALEWVVAGYGLTYSALLIPSGRLGDRYGRRRLLSIGFAVFAVASAGCGLSADAASMIAFRLLQGAGAALIGPSVLAIIGATFAGAERGRAIALYGTVMGIAAASGQLIGGILIQAAPGDLGWRLVFLINLPVAAAALLLSPTTVAESRSPAAPEIDWAGAGLASAALTLIVLPLVQGRQYGWPAWSFACLALAPVAAWLFGRRRAPGSLMANLQTVKGRPFAAGILTQLALWCGQASFFLVLGLFLQLGRGLDALQAGLIFTFMAVSYLVASMRSAALVVRYGRSVVAVGAVVLALGHLTLAVAVLHGGSVLWLAPGLVVAGLGMGLCISPLATVVMSAADPASAGTVSSVMSTVQQVGNSIGVALIGIVFFGQLHHGFAGAFEWSEAGLVVLLLAVAGLSRLLPGPGAAAAVAPTGAPSAVPVETGAVERGYSAA
ncbi:MAG TPA: MFS transporter [Acidimicrobiales bacterium]|nr:MFS transporter [Acidimicrobiales bacterium]